MACRRAGNANPCWDKPEGFEKAKPAATRNVTGFAFYRPWAMDHGPWTRKNIALEISREQEKADFF
jgi:hypothetical protein